MSTGEWVAVGGFALAIISAIIGSAWIASRTIFSIGQKLGEIEANTLRIDLSLADIRKYHKITNKHIEKLFSIADDHSRQLATMTVKLDESRSEIRRQDKDN